MDGKVVERSTVRRKLCAVNRPLGPKEAAHLTLVAYDAIIMRPTAIIGIASPRWDYRTGGTFSAWQEIGGVLGARVTAIPETSTVLIAIAAVAFLPTRRRPH